MKQRPRIKNASLPSESLNERVTAYALIASAASVGVLALPCSASAEIVFTPTHSVLTYGLLPIDLNHDGVPDYLLIDNGQYKTKLTTSCSFCGQYLDVRGSAQVVAQHKRASALPAGAVIGSSNTFENATGKGLLMASAFNDDNSFFNLYGQFANTTDRFLGLRFQINGQTHYGWARFAVVRAGFDFQPYVPFVTAVITGYAYETIPNKPIVAGQIKATDETSTIMPETNPAPTSVSSDSAMLGLLAQGASGLAVWRRDDDLFS